MKFHSLLQSLWSKNHSLKSPSNVRLSISKLVYMQWRRKNSMTVSLLSSQLVWTKSATLVTRKIELNTSLMTAKFNSMTVSLVTAVNRISRFLKLVDSTLVVDSQRASKTVKSTMRSSSVMVCAIEMCASRVSMEKNLLKMESTGKSLITQEEQMLTSHLSSILTNSKLSKSSETSTPHLFSKACLIQLKTSASICT